MCRHCYGLGYQSQRDLEVYCALASAQYCPPVQLVQCSPSPIQPSILMFMSFGRALFVAWCVWIGTLVVGSVVVLLLDKPEWRVAVGTLSLLIGLLAFIYSRRI